MLDRTVRLRRMLTGLAFPIVGRDDLAVLREADGANGETERTIRFYEP